MRRALRTTALALGLYAGLLGIVHGLFETRQGALVPDGIIVNAIGVPCQAETVWHACLPAMTVVPSFLVTGILAIVLGLCVSIWAAVFVRHRNGGLVLMLLSIGLLLVGGGFVPAYAGVMAGLAGTGVHAPLNRWRRTLSGRAGRSLARAWPWVLALFVGWSLGGWVLGLFFNQALMSLGFVTFFFLDLGLPVLAVLTALARDSHRIGGKL
jgi:hypothetical protein